MPILSLQLADFRNIATALLYPCTKGFNVIVGDNGSGKTSLLEAIYYLGMGKSFRSSTLNRLISTEADKFLLFAKLYGELERHIPIGVERYQNGTTRIKIDAKEPNSMAEMTAVMPIRIINTHTHQLFESGPAFRRKYLDWGLFYQEEGFLPCWRHYERVLRQRNALLRERRPLRELTVWSEAMATHGLALHQFRQAYVQALTPRLREVTALLLGIDGLQIDYYPGWDESEDFATLLMESAQEEYRFGHTQYGPHRADLEVKIDGLAVKHFLSRGQQKLMVCAMILAQGMMLFEAVNKRVIYLVDDLPAELDKHSRDRLITMLSRQETQVFVTAIEKEAIDEFTALQPDVSIKVFHVEHGRVAEGN